MLYYPPRACSGLALFTAMVVAAYGDDEQVSTIHEFGHIIGCRHPGEPGGDDEYTADEDSLMGLGMELRPIYFAAWAIELSEHIPQNGPYGVGEQP